MGVIAWIFLGLIAGVIARVIVPGRGGGCLTTIVLGIIGAVVGGWIATELGADDGVTGINLWSVAVAGAGAILVLFVYRAIRRR